MVHAKKRLGQHFLHDPGVIRRLIDVIRPVPGDRMVEIGGGPGALTAPLVERLGLQDVIHLIHGDATKVEIPEPADVCVSEIVGPIGGCEGAAVLIKIGRAHV